MAKEQWVNARIASSTFPLPAIHNTGSSTRSLGKMEGEIRKQPQFPVDAMRIEKHMKHLFFFFVVFFFFFLGGGGTTFATFFLGS